MEPKAPPEPRCVRCGGLLPEPVLGGHCPQCLVRTTLSAETADHVPPLDAPLVFMRSFGDYELLDEIARGGMGVVYRARQRSLNRIVALKMLLAGEFASADFVRRFRQEAEAAASLHHPNIVAIYEVGQWDGQHFFSMEFIEGRNLADLVRERPFSSQRAADYLKIITEAVAFAHDHNIVHRDLKPSNILIDPFDQPRITDFGLARQLRADESLTVSGQALGSPAYMAPEQASGQGKVGPAADLYSLGALLYHLITGRPPFQSDTVAATLLQVQEETPLPPRRLNSSVSEDLQTIVLKCLEKDPARRYRTARELGDDLGSFLRGEPIRARPVSPFGKLWLWCQRRPAIAALSASVLLLLLVVAIGSPIAAWRISVARNAENRERSKAESVNLELRSANKRLGDTVSILELQRAEDLFQAHDSASGVAHLSAMLRNDPSNHIAASRLISSLVHRDWVLPSVPPLLPQIGVQMVEFARDGQHFLTAGGENKAQVWNSRTGESLLALVHDDRILSARYSPDGRHIVTASADGSGRIWNATNGMPLSPPLRHEGKLHWAEFSSDSGSVVTASADKSARVWALVDGQLRFILPDHDSSVLRAHFSPDGKRIATVSESGSIRLWNGDSGSFDFELKGHQVPVHALAFSPDGQRLAAACAGGAAWLWNSIDPQTKSIALPHSFWAPPVWHVTFSPNSQLLLTTSEDSTARLWNASTGFPVGQPFVHEGGVVFGAFSPDGEKIATASSDISARLWDWRSGKPFGQPLRHLKRVRYAAFSPDGQRLISTSMGHTAIWEIKARQSWPVEIRHPPRVTSVEFNSRDPSLLTTSLDQTARIWDARNGQPVGKPMRFESPVLCGKLSKDGQLALIGCANGATYIWNLNDRSLVAGPVWHSNSITSVRFSGDDKQFVTTSLDKTARGWNTASGTAVTPPLVHRAAVLTASFSLDGKHIVTTSEDWTARVWDSQTGKPISKSLLHLDHVKWADFSPDGKKVVTASTDNSACIWDVGTSRRTVPVLQHARIVEMAMFSPDGQRVVTASLDRTARIWDSQTGLALTPPLKHQSAVSHVAFSPDGSRILTGGWDGFVRIWDSNTGRPVTEWFFGGGNISALSFDSTGQKIATGSQNGFARIWDVPIAPTPVPAWFPAFAEAVAGIRLSPRGNVELIPRNELESATTNLTQLSANDFYERVARWFLTDPAQRPGSPF